MTNSEDPIDPSFLEQKHRYFDLLCRNLGLEAGLQENGRDYAIASAAAGNVRVFFEHERGLGGFAVGAFDDVRPLCSVEGLALRFPRIRVLSEGRQRLDLDEQRRFIEGRWSDLQVMFSADHIGETRSWHRAAAAAYMEQLSGKK
jgi:hypothetical protein